MDWLIDILIVAAVIFWPVTLGLVFSLLEYVFKKAQTFFRNNKNAGKAIISVIALLLSAAIGLGAGYHVFAQQEYDKGYESGRIDGYSNGYQVGSRGKDSAAEVRYKAGYNAGYNDGYDDGYDDGCYDSDYDYYEEEYTYTDTIVYVTNTGSKYHQYWCSYLHSSSNAVYLSWATSSGYSACSRCW